MIPLSRPYSAVLLRTREDGTDYQEREPVHAWDDEGRPMIIDPVRQRRLVPATELENFLFLEEDHETKIAVVPGAGWQVELSYPLETSTHPVLAWAISCRGFASPIVVNNDDGHGEVEDGNNVRAIPPAI